MLERITMIRLVVVVGLLVGAVSCADHPTQPSPTPSPTPAPTPSQTFLLSGRVTEGTFPLEDAQVEAESVSGTVRTMTAAGGGYRLQVAPGDFTVRVKKDGFSPQVKQVTVERDETVDFVLQRLASSANVLGVYTLAFTASPSCALPPEAMHRTYTARIQQGRDVQRAEDLIVTLTGADFVGWANEAGFTGWRDGTTIHFDITDNFFEDYALIERLPSGTDLYYSGKATGTASGPTIVATFNGRLQFGYQGTECRAADHRLEFVR